MRCIQVQQLKGVDMSSLRPGSRGCDDAEVKGTKGQQEGKFKGSRLLNWQRSGHLLRTQCTAQTSMADWGPLTSTLDGTLDGL